ncbi:baseplate J/gp47 family protein [Paenibacillus sp. IB182496]|uniref:Baseplate J/gp47 family protein n=1 Tax=Paenibacillus sabuli TaxID=2772509 RepID=A0A927BVB9_9BACL|nr:baseplate J/gp47 family protein [Paenibacillus sabuli]MBD2846184.1 baseplate J/gp47 family protein [Paenibacillus sabuli]
MYETYTFQYVLQRMLDRIPQDLDRREGSIIHDALAPAAAELAQLYIQLDVQRNLVFADTASGDYLSRRVAEFGVQRKAATRARWEAAMLGTGEVPTEVPIGSRFGSEGLVYVAARRIEAGRYELECETPGNAGNQPPGPLLPLSYIEGLVTVELLELLVPGEATEDDEALRRRYYAAVNEPAYGGNVADYKQKVEAMDGVGAVKVIPVWNGGGTVKCVLIAADWSAPSAALLDQVKQALDPEEGSGQGLGIAPIGHQVTVEGVAAVTLDVTTTLTLGDGMTTGQVQEPVEQAIGDYLLRLRESWAEASHVIVRIALLEAAILGVPGVIDVTGTTLGGSPDNLPLGAHEVPVLGEVSL